MSRFARFMGWIRAIEGSESNDPRDTGGLTVVGITAPALVGIDRDKDGRWDYDLDGDGDVDAVDVALLRARPELVEAYYRAEIWDRFGADELPWAIALSVCDLAVHSGRRAASLATQRAINATLGRRHLLEDGVWGRRTALAAGMERPGLVDALELERRLLLGAVIRRRTRTELARLLESYTSVVRRVLEIEPAPFQRVLAKAEAYGTAFERGWLRRLALLAREAQEVRP